MTRSRPWTFLLAALPVLLAVAAGPAAAADGGLGGFILDAAGEPLAGVEVLLGQGGGVLTTLTDAGGRYRFRDLLPGSYLLLATKTGYRASLVRVNTLAASTLDLTLRLLGDPAGTDGAVVPPPPDEDWVLRLPARDVLREVGREDVMTLGPRREAGEAAADPDPEAELARSRRFNAQIQQWFSVALGGAEPAADVLDEGRSTEIVLDGDNGEGVIWSVAGGSGRSVASFEEADLAAVDEQTHQVQVSVNVSPDKHNQVDISAWFDQSDHTYNLAGMEEGEDAGRRSRVWGYDARWSSQRNGSDMDLRVGYGSANVGALRSAEFFGSDDMHDEHWRANGSVSFSPARRHRLRLGMRANLYEFGSDDLRLTLDPSLAGPGGPVGAGRRGWSVNLYGKESYEISEPLALDVGLDYHHVGFEQPVSYLLPQAGVTYRPGEHQTVRAMVMVKLEDGPDSLPGREDQEADSRTSGRFGYLLSWDREIGDDMSVSVAAAIRPYAQERLVADEYVAYDPATHRALFVSDGNASSRELSLRFEKRLQDVHSSVGVRFGEVEGSLISYLPSEIPTQALSEDLVRFVSTGVHTVILPSGTSVSIDYQRIENRGMLFGDAPLGPMTYAALEMVVQQALFSRLGGGEWRLLVGYQEVANTSDEAQSVEELARLGVPDQLRRVSGGVSIRF